MPDLFSLEGRAAIVTGASRGIGAASAIALAQSGAHVVIAARNGDHLAGVAAQVTATGRRAEVVVADLSDLDALPALVERAQSSFGRLDVVVNNVGGTVPRAAMDTSPGYLERAFHFNVTVAFQLTKLSVPLLLESGHGSVINISSAMARLRDRGFLAYATSKAALSHLTRALSVDLGPRIRVNGIAPGTIETEALGMFVDDATRAQMASVTPLKRLGTPEDIAAGVIYLASDASAYVTGKVLEIDGGQEQPTLPLGLPDL
jgi:7-alpha-hydroxysteroid dehydrogenase